MIPPPYSGPSLGDQNATEHEAKGLAAMIPPPTVVLVWVTRMLQNTGNSGGTPMIPPPYSGS